MARHRKMFNFVLCTFLVVASVATGVNYCECKIKIYNNRIRRYTCTCDGTDEKVKLNYIPLTFPNKTQEVIFIRNELHTLSKVTLKGLSALPLTHLNLKYNNISLVEHDSFIYLKHLTTLDLSGNLRINQRDLLNSFQSLTKSIRELRLNHLHWHPPRLRGMFYGLAGSDVRRIELSHSYLTPFDGIWFRNLKYLKQLDVSWNSIKDGEYNFKELGNLTWLHMAGNWINTVPDFCGHGLRKLATLFLTDTKLYTLVHLRNNTRCLTNLSVLNLGGLSIRNIPNNVFSELKSLHVLTITKMGTQLTNIYPYAFNSSSLSSLSFWRADGYRFSKKMAEKQLFDPKLIFKHCPNLVSLDLSHNIIQFTNKVIRDMFNPLKKLTKIWFEAMNLGYIPNHFFYKFPKLNKLDLSDNRISSWKHGSVFNGLHKLRELNLRNNKITTLYPSSIQPKVMNSLRQLDLSSNHFTCSCELRWFRDWMKVTKVKLVNKRNYTCDNLKIMVADYNPTTLECNILIISLSAGCSLGVIVAAIIFVYFCRWRIRFQLYKLRSMRRYYTQLQNQNEYVYTAYVIYCYEDFTWVKNYLIPKTEEEFGFKLCIPHRDFELGKVFADNIVEHMDLSKVVVPVLSNNFSRNEWCLFQLAVARNKLTKDGRILIFPIMLDEVEFKYMNSSVYSLIKLSSYAAWENNENAVELFWDKIRDNLRNEN